MVYQSVSECVFLFFGVLIEFFRVFFKKRTLYSVWNLCRKQMLLDVKQRWWTSSAFGLFIHGHPVVCGVRRLERVYSLFLLSSCPFILRSNRGTRTTSLAQAFCDMRLECVKLHLFLFPHARAVSNDGHHGHVDKVVHQPLVPLLPPDFVAV